MLSNGVKGQEDIVINQVSSRKTSHQYIFLYRINFHSYSREGKFPQNSEVLKLLREQEAAVARPGVAGMSALQENRNYNSNNVFTWKLEQPFLYFLYFSSFPFPTTKRYRTEHMYHLTLSFGLMVGNHFASQGNQNSQVPVPLSVRHINLQQDNLFYNTKL